MKRILIMIIFFILSSQLSATNCFQSLSASISNIGQSIENINNIPMIDKAVNILPVAIIAAALRQCPMQTMMVLSFLGAYIFSHNEKVRKVMDKYEITDYLPWVKRTAAIEEDIDENIFVFDADQTNMDLSRNEWLADTTDNAKQFEVPSNQQDFL